MRRGDVVTVAISGDYGKPRPAIVITANTLLGTDHPGIAVCQLTSELLEGVNYRVLVEPSADNGLRLRSDIMADKPMAVTRRRIGAIIGHLSEPDILRLNIALAFALGLSD